MIIEVIVRYGVNVAAGETGKIEGQLGQAGYFRMVKVSPGPSPETVKSGHRPMPRLTNV